MKKVLKGGALIILGLIGFNACAGNDSEPEPTTPTVDNSITCKAASDAGSYSTFFKPNTGWVGDPMPFYDNGKFYLFYLQDWRNDSPHFHPWHMASTTDFANFTYSGEAISCGSETAQDIAIGTGSVIKANGIYYAFYTGHRWNYVAPQPKEAVMLATSTDLKVWQKNSTFLLSASSTYDKNEFRDPFLYFDAEAQLYKMLVSTRRYNSAVLALYTSTDLLNWTLKDPLYTDPSVYMVECADLFKQGNYWYLIYSDINDRKVHYKISNSQNGPWSVPANTMMDGIAFYAAKTASNGTDRYLSGWCPTKQGESDYGNFDWAGSSVTHQLIQQVDGTFKLTIPTGVDAKFSKLVEYTTILNSGDVERQGNSFTINGNAFSVQSRLPSSAKLSMTITSVDQQSSFGIGFGACDKQEEVYSIRFDLKNKKIKLDRDLTSSGIKTSTTLTEQPLANLNDGVFDVKVVIEKSVCVIYVNGEIAFTNRIYKMNQNPWTLFADGGTTVFSDVVLNSL